MGTKMFWKEAGQTLAIPMLNSPTIVKVFAAYKQ